MTAVVTSPASIRPLPPDVAAQIAAGEVIERPAAVVKELVENALDAGATAIDIEVAGAGTGSIVVSDNGRGIPSDQLIVAFERHATSKLTNIDDLERVATLGFRGEALASIAAAADIELRSRSAGDGMGGRVSFEGGVLAKTGPAAQQRGTRVEVTRLFERQPARLKFLRTAASENAAIAASVAALALGYPAVRFTLRLDGRDVLTAPGSGDLRDAARAVFGEAAAPALIALPDGSFTSRGAVTVAGLVSPSHVHRSNRSQLVFFVNGRLIQSRRLAFAVETAYQGMLPVARHPIGVVKIAVPLDEVDVNIHPTKAEVRFRFENEVFAAVERSVRDAVSAGSPVPAFQQSRFASFPEPPPAHGTAGATLWERVGIEPVPHAPVVNAGMAALPPRAETLPPLRVVGQVGATFVVAEGPDGLYLVDQHAAHERVMYEKILRERSPGVEQQPLLDPAMVQLTPRQDALLAGNLDTLAAFGFEVEPFGERIWRVRVMPAVLARQGDPAARFTAFVDDLDREDAGPGRDERVVKSLACHAAVRKGKILVPDEMRELLVLLEACQAPRTCAHGRPTVVHFSAALLEREFLRR